MKMLFRKYSPVNKSLLQSVFNAQKNCCINVSKCSSLAIKDSGRTSIDIQGKSYSFDNFTNVTPKILSHVGKNLHNQKYHPLCMLKQRIINFFYTDFVGNKGYPIFSIYDSISPVVTVEENFDSLLVPSDHPSRSQTDCYYLNGKHLLRAHTTAHQSELIRMGLDNFVVFGDVYRRDQIDSTHYPVFHQADGVHLLNKEQMSNSAGQDLVLFEHNGVHSDAKQAIHTLDATKVMEQKLKTSLMKLAKSLFGAETEMRWINEYFPFTHPSWELEILLHGKWVEILGCGIIRHEILDRVGAGDRIGWAFGLGLERIAMQLYSIPDIRTFFSEDPGFLNQFRTEDVNQKIVFKPVSVCPPCINDLSFWLPQGQESNYSVNDFYDLVRSVGGDMVEQIHLVDEFKHPKSGKASHCYRIVYRHLERTLTQAEVNELHKKIEQLCTQALGVTIR
uniref:Phenylalanine--tRNA ligase, mitochondrial n=1 Tax=Cacopsylla melanoneura TaxID=428564 RepID=A0A8D8S128_9HEMI